MGATHQLLRFGIFELNLDTEELRKDGTFLKLSPQPFRILALLASRAGQIVTREEIQKQIWGDETFVDFEHGLNQCIKQIRTVLNDNADHPVYVETLPRRGYRFLAPVVSKTIASPLPKVVESKSGIQPSLLPKAVEKPPTAGTLDTREGLLPSARLEPATLTGKTVSHYRVLNVIGGGGMGVVYKAEDLKLPRAVALKFLPEEVRNDPMALEQFAREARSASVLDHTNICSIYEFGEHEGRPFIVMQLLEGQTLRDLLASGDAQNPGEQALPLEKLLTFALQIVEGLEAAHEKGIVHRDIKPANIFITTKGVVKILDFGLAKPIQSFEKEEAGVAAGIDSGSASQKAPVQAMSVGFQSLATGTAAYMSPEQARGEPLDARTDLFSFGLVLYEMATGQQAFRSDSVAGLQDLILHSTPTPVQELNPRLPEELQAVVGRCMERDRELRYQRAADIRHDLDEIRRENQRPFWQRRWKWLAAAAVLVVALSSGGGYWHLRKHVTFTGKDTIVLADFNNTTGDPVFDGTLRQGLAAQLEQSPFLNLLPEPRVVQALGLMSRPKDTPLTAPIAREICQRTGSAATIEGSVSRLGNEYVLGLQAVNCRTAEVITEEQVTANAKEQVLTSLGKAATQLRGKLGESRASLQKFDVPLEQATTSSLEALKAYSVAMRTRDIQGDPAALPLFKMALELDPNFTMAYARLGTSYANLNEPTLAAENFSKAYELQKSASANEKFYINAHYYSKVLGDLNKARETDLLWTQIYPHELWPYLQLVHIDAIQGNYQQALDEVQTAIHLNAGGSRGFSTATALIASYMNLDRFQDAEVALKQAEADGIKREALLKFSYQLAFFRRDTAGMAAALDALKGQSRQEAELLQMQADTEAYFGRLTNARQFSQRAIDSAQHSGATESAAMKQVTAALHQAEIGERARGRGLALAASGSCCNASYVMRAQAALALARNGDPSHARALADKLASQFPNEIMLNAYWLPTIRGAIALAENNSHGAVDVLQAATQYELGSPDSAVAYLYPVYLRGLAFLQLHQGDQAAAEFQKMLNHSGIVLNFPTGALAYLQLARAQEMTGRKDAAAKSYQQFLALWKDADPDIPALVQAKTEYARLQ